MTSALREEHSAVSSAELSAAMAAVVGAQGFAACSATVIGAGHMGQQYVRALRALGVQSIRICSRSANGLESFRDLEKVETVSGGIEQFAREPQPGELGIVATPTALLASAAERLAGLGFRRLLIEKPVSLWPEKIERLAGTLEAQGVEAFCAYNRVAYPSFHEVRARAASDGGVTSCAYTFTEMIKPDWPRRFPAEELARWGIANSLHVMSMAHGLIGFPASWHSYRSGALSWHPAGAMFVGAGRSDQGVPFSYHADWGSKGRWSVEIHSSVSSYRLCPLEQVFRKSSALSDWEEIPVSAFAPGIKTGLVEQVAAMLDPKIRGLIPLVSLRDAATLTKFAQAVFGYAGHSETPTPS